MTTWPVTVGRVIEACWEEHGPYSALEMTLTVTHDDGTRTYVVVPVSRMTHRIPADQVNADAVDGNEDE